MSTPYRMNVARPAAWSPKSALVSFIGLLVSAVLLWWAARGLSLADVMGHVRGAHGVPVVLSLLLATLLFPVRTLRWQRMLCGPGGSPPGFTATWHGIAIGYMANTLLPFRAGEVLRCHTLSRLSGLSLSGALASVALERLFDAVMVVVLLSAAVLIATPPVGLELAGVPVPVLIQRVAVVGVVAVPAFLYGVRRADVLAALIRRRFPGQSFAGRVAGALERVVAEVGGLGSPLRLALVLGLSLAVWLLNALSLFVLLPAFGISVHFPGVLVLQAVLVFGVALPSSPGFVGVYEAAIVFTLGLYGVDRSQALAYALVSHVLAFVPITLLGLYSVVRTRLGFMGSGAAVTPRATVPPPQGGGGRQRISSLEEAERPAWTPPPAT